MVLVVGGGPAGLATAIALAEQNIAALVVERGVYDDGRIGEHLEPSAVVQLRSIDSRSNLPLESHFASGGMEAYGALKRRTTWTTSFTHKVELGTCRARRL
jgi:2-polyprenyl-6-methoxyphenol hydroxylase-like FAD-dependent oxidoreductase